MKKIVLVLMALLSLGVANVFAYNRCPECGAPIKYVEKDNAFFGQYIYICVNGHENVGR